MRIMNLIGDYEQLKANGLTSLIEEIIGLTH